MDALKRSLGLGATSQSSGGRRGGGQAQDGGSSENGDVRQKIWGFWHSMKYGRTLFALDASHPSSFTGGVNPVWFLGMCYQGRTSSENKLSLDTRSAQIERTPVRRAPRSIY